MEGLHGIRVKPLMTLRQILMYAACKFLPSNLQYKCKMKSPKSSGKQTNELKSLKALFKVPFQLDTQT